MGRWVCGVLALLLALLAAVGRAGGHPAEDLVERLPGQPKVGFRQYAGYVDVDAEAGRSLFYYYVEAEGDAEKKPLTLWLNGGPGCSSVGGGAFTELGPFFPRGDGRGLRINKKSWNKASNILFVESPAGVGWSYSRRTSDYTCGDESTARDMLTFLIEWFKKFPDLGSRDLFLTGESYAGHYIPQLADVLLEHNEHSTGFKFNIKGLAIGNPLLKLDRDVPATYEFFWSHGMISDEIGLTIMSDCNFEDYVFESHHNVSKACSDAIDAANHIVGDYINSYDVILDVCYPSLVEQELRLRKYATKKSVGVDVCMSYERGFYFNIPEVQAALHANRTHLPYQWTMCSEILNYSQADGDVNILPVLKKIIQLSIPVWIFSGDQDSVVPLLGSRTLVRELAQDLNFNVTVPYSAWFHRDQFSHFLLQIKQQELRPLIPFGSDVVVVIIVITFGCYRLSILSNLYMLWYLIVAVKVGGWATEYGNLLTFATVRGASHMVPYAQPARALTLFRTFLAGKRLPNKLTNIPY
ncbi:hypothetical protein Taro_035552 [Colocasia esculenta]|uniref:Carboxypeptidase n=1 Tax=Colocasia esculenta TaxID=4460 RepID=A0A843WAU3_COLES|nr:hypothetical protein [Colocasia esculenta]